MSIRQLFKPFVSNRSGNFAMMMSLLAVPIIGAAGLALDYNNISRLDAKLQNANDAASLFAASVYEQKGKLPSNSAIRKFIAANFEMDIKKPRVSISDNKIVVSSESKYKPILIHVLYSKKKLNVDAVSAVNLPGDKEIEVAMVLDNTASMEEDGKIDALKKAGKDFLDTMFAGKSSKTYVHVALVPFSNHVNVGLKRRNESWLDVPEDTVTEIDTCWWKRKRGKKIGEETVTKWRDGVPKKYKRAKYEWGEKYKVCGKRKTTSKWYGCVGTRNRPFHLTDARPDVKFPGLMNTYCTAELTPLSDDKKLLSKKIEKFATSGETYMATGIMWGIRTLSPKLPFTEGKVATKAKEVEKILILMTDGENTKSARVPKSPVNLGTNAAQANDWTKQACDVARSLKIQVYTVTFGTKVPKESKKLMEACADDKDHYFDAVSSAKLNTVFQNIAGKIKMVYLSQ